MEKIQSKRDQEVLVNYGFMYIFDKFRTNKQKNYCTVYKVIWITIIWI